MKGTSTKVIDCHSFINESANLFTMDNKRYESRLFFVMLFAVIGLGFLATILDPTRTGADNGNVMTVESRSGIDLVLLWFGVTMVLSGVIIRFVAIATLKKNFSSRLRIRDDHALIKTGIYRWIRHPAYLGLILVFLGIPVIESSVLGFLVMLLIVPLLIHRISLEESMLIERFGAEYEEYRKNSKKLIPFLY